MATETLRNAYMKDLKAKGKSGSVLYGGLHNWKYASDNAEINSLTTKTCLAISFSTANRKESLG